MKIEINSTGIKFDNFQNLMKEINITDECGNIGLLPQQIGQCSHVWETYKGLTELFHYCSLCNQKR